LPSEQLSTREFRRILLIKLSALGDVLHTIPVLHKLRRRYPSARIDWLTRPAFAELLRHQPAISNVIEFARQEWLQPWRWSPYASAARLAAGLKSNRYDLVIDLHGQSRSALFALATGASVRVGFDRPRRELWKASKRILPRSAQKHAWQGAREGSWLAYTHHIQLPTLDLHAVDRYLSIGSMLGFDAGPADFSFVIPDAARTRIEALLAEHGIGADLLAMAPGSIWETKHWRIQGFAEVASHFMGRGFAVVLTGSGRERAVCEAVAAAAPGALNLAGETTLSELAALIRRSTICLTNDSGPMHLAVALDRPVASIFGPTDPVWVGPYRRPDAVLRAKLSCSPCYLRLLSLCPYDHACMQEISAAAVIERIETKLALADPAGEPEHIGSWPERR
jgi:lipopolysaccharide heptosyltransferase I